MRTPDSHRVRTVRKDPLLRIQWAATILACKGTLNSKASGELGMPSPESFPDHGITVWVRLPPKAPASFLTILW
jgi:hypothetical protein